MRLVTVSHPPRGRLDVLVAIMVWTKLRMSLSTTRKRCTGLASPALGSIVLICTHCRTGFSTKPPLGSKMLLFAISTSMNEYFFCIVPDGALCNRLFCHGDSCAVDACGVKGMGCRWRRTESQSGRLGSRVDASVM